MIEVKGFVVMFLITIIFVVMVLVTIKKMQWARSIKKQGERGEAEISPFTN
jgi:hypothetical protein